MSYSVQDDLLATDPDVLSLSDSAFRLYMCGLSFSAAHLTDGVIDRDVAPVMPGSRKVRASDINQLTAKGLWEQFDGSRSVELPDGNAHQVTGPAGFYIRSWHRYNEPAARIKTRRAKVREERVKAGRRGADSRWHPDGKAIANEWQNDGPTPTPSPTPTPTVSNGAVEVRPDERRCRAWLRDHGVRDDGEATATIAEARGVATLRTGGQLKSLDSYAMTNPKPGEIHLLEEVFLRRLNAQREARDRERDRELVGASAVPLPRLRRIE